MMLTARVLGAIQPARWPAWWLAGVAFIAIELVVHALLLVRGQDGFFEQWSAAERCSLAG